MSPFDGVTTIGDTRCAPLKPKDELSPLVAAIEQKGCLPSHHFIVTSILQVDVRRPRQSRAANMWSRLVSPSLYVPKRGTLHVVLEYTHKRKVAPIACVPPATGLQPCCPRKSAISRSPAAVPKCNAERPPVHNTLSAWKKVFVGSLRMRTAVVRVDGRKTGRARETAAWQLTWLDARLRPQSSGWRCCRRSCACRIASARCCETA